MILFHVNSGGSLPLLADTFSCYTIFVIQSFFIRFLLLVTPIVFILSFMIASDCTPNSHLFSSSFFTLLKVLFSLV